MQGGCREALSSKSLFKLSSGRKRRELKMTAASSNNSSRPPHNQRGHIFAPLLIAASTIYLCVYAPITINGQSVQNYARSVEPIFQEKCVACHNHAVRQGGLNLESYEALMNGGKHGAVVSPGKSDE